MKTRNDFVSNSSSSSFIISNESGDVTLFAQRFAETFNDCYVSYAYSASIAVNVRTANKNFKQLWSFFNDGKLSDIVLSRLSECPDEISWEPLNISLDEVKSLAMNPTIVSKIDSMRFTAKDDYDEVKKMRLATFFKFCRAIGCNPDASVSDVDFLHDTDKDQFESKMLEQISAYEKRNHVD